MALCFLQVTTFTDYIDGARIFLEGENDKEIGPSVRDIKIHFCSFIRNLISGFSRKRCDSIEFYSLLVLRHQPRTREENAAGIFLETFYWV